MELQISERIFELLLAEWAGYGEYPEKVFSGWKNLDKKLIADELDAVLENVQYRYAAGDNRHWQPVAGQVIRCRPF